MIIPAVLIFLSLLGIIYGFKKDKLWSIILGFMFFLATAIFCGIK